jgi:hypothetical protein
MRTVTSGSPRALLLLLAAIAPFGSLGCVAAFSTGSEGGEDASNGGPEAGPQVEAGSQLDATADGRTDAAGNAHDSAASDGHEDATGEGQDAAGSDSSSVGPMAEASAPEGSAEASATCSAPNLECAAGCVPSDVHNCGSCGNDCTNLSHVSGAVSCTAASACSFPASSCAPGWADCDGNPANGCETDLSQTATCGACTTTCGSSAPVCAGSGGAYGCVTGCSGATPLLCSGTCVDPTDNASHCDTCPNACGGVANGQAECANSACTFSCNSGYSACPTTTPTACVNEQGDTSNCGACNKACPQSSNGGGTPACTAGVCGLTCNAGLTACPVAAPTECANTTDDLSNCGTCGNVCAQVANGAPRCTSSQCGFTCDTDFLKCNGACIPAADATNGVFVSPSGSGPTCTEAAPCATIAAALALVAAGGKSIVYLDQGTYTEQVTLPAATVAIHGGWSFSGGTWTNCGGTNATSIIAAPVSANAAANATVVASANGTWTLDTLTINDTITAATGQSLYGVFQTAGALTISNVAMNVAAGGGGTPGTAGTLGGPPKTCTGAGTGASGVAGVVGAGAFNGTYAATGFVPSSGGTGNPGFAGSNGVSPAAPACVTVDTVNCGGTYPACTTTPMSGQCCAAAGGIGCGSSAAGGGNPGSGGGASIGVFGGGGTTTFGPLVAIETGAGGAGGSGGAGGMGTGSTGAESSTEIDTKCGITTNPVGTKICGVAASAVGCTGPGSTGGNSGVGGQGGGGAGGDSYCYATASGGATATGVTCSHGSGGAGGNQGLSNPGATGKSG